MSCVICSDEKIRYSEDTNETRDYLKGLISNGEIVIVDVLAFFNYACGAYKEASRVIGGSDAKINIEFNYAARALASFIGEDDVNGKQLALLDAFQASRHIINDSLDLILGEVERHLRDARNINLDITISSCIEDFETLFKKKESIHAVVSESRRLRGKFRYQAYLELINNEPYIELINFLSKIKQALFKLGNNQIEIRRRNKRDLCIIILSIALGVFGAVGVLFPKSFESLGDTIKNTFFQPTKNATSKTT